MKSENIYLDGSLVSHILSRGFCSFSKLKFPSVYECVTAALCCVGVTSALCTGALNVLNTDLGGCIYVVIVIKLCAFVFITLYL